MRLDGPQRNVLTGLGLLVAGAIIQGLLPPECLASALVLLAGAWHG